MDFLKGFKTFTGIALLTFSQVAQLASWDWYAAISGQVETAANHVVGLVGTIVALYGWYMKVKREKAMKAELEVKR